MARATLVIVIIILCLLVLGSCGAILVAFSNEFAESRNGSTETSQSDDRTTRSASNGDGDDGHDHDEESDCGDDCNGDSDDNDCNNECNGGDDDDDNGCNNSCNRDDDDDRVEGGTSGACHPRNTGWDGCELAGDVDPPRNGNSPSYDDEPYESDLYGGGRNCPESYGTYDEEC